ncbi:MAG TPA: type II secretion system F family protein [Hyphomicrobiaceae bacterium]|jgi:general secretion pathway protein F|nr:type II secretion system F family protein [Hyphomicrobiaceae bacterium]
MPRYSYKAYDAKGGRLDGEIESETREAALEALVRQGRYALELVEGGGKAPSLPWWQRDLFAARRLSQQNIALLTRELATLVKAELPIDQALRIVVLQPLISARTRQVVAAVLARVLDGAALSEALSAQQGAFPEFYWRIVHAGEASGTLGPALDDLAHLLDRSMEFRARIVSALVYPATLLLAAGAALVIVLTILIPTIAPMFKEAGKEPPALIGSLIAFQDFLSEHWFVTLVAGGLALAALIGLFRQEAWRLMRDRMMLRLPLISGLVENGQTAVFARTLGTMIKSGVPMLRALGVAADALRNRAMSGAVHACASEMREGGGLVGSLGKSGLFPELSLRLIGVGEQSGQLDTMLGRVADIYEAALQRQLDRVTSLLTPILTVVIGVVVGGLILSVIGAIVSVNELALQ